MADISTIVDSLYPPVSGISIPTGISISVTFDQEMDEETVSNSFFVTGPDNDTWSGPDFAMLDGGPSPGDEEDILQSPGFDGIVQGEITFQRIDLVTDDVVTTKDTVGSGLLYRTKAIFTPTNRLREDTEYEVFLSGDDDTTDSYETGVSRRTVFDPVADGGNTGSGDDPVFSGGYVGLAIQDTYVVTITTGGATETAKFQFTKGSDPLDINGPFLAKRSPVLLSDGVSVAFGSGTYAVGDSWTVIVKQRNVFEGNLIWSFKTGDGSIQTIPDSVSSGIPCTTTSTSASTFEVTSMTPAHQSTHLDYENINTIEIVFSKDIDPASITQSGVLVQALATDDDPATPADGIMNRTLTVQGNKLIITLED